MLMPTYAIDNTSNHPTDTGTVCVEYTDGGDAINAVDDMYDKHGIMSATNWGGATGRMVLLNSKHIEKLREVYEAYMQSSALNMKM